MSEIKKQILTLLKQGHHSHKVALEQEKDPRSKHAIDLIARIREDSRLMELIDSLPEEKPSKDLEEEIQGMYQAIFGTDIINRREMVYLETFDMLARHFAEWGAKHKDSLQVQETCKENQDSFTSLEEAADEYSEKHGFRVPYDGSNNFYDAVDVKASKEGFIAGAKWMESQMPMPEDTVIFMKGVKEGRRLEREDRNDDKLPRYYGD